ncbi:hypothetical protein BJX70DRAFT_370036 [Aspergillus crustosus]
MIVLPDTIWPLTSFDHSDSHIMVVSKLRRRKTGPHKRALSRDAIEHFSLTELASRELQRRTLKHHSEQPRRASASVTFVLRRLGPEQLRELVRYARFGGPDITDIRNVRLTFLIQISSPMWLISEFQCPLPLGRHISSFDPPTAAGTRPITERLTIESLGDDISSISTGKSLYSCSGETWTTHTTTTQTDTSSEDSFLSEDTETTSKSLYEDPQEAPAPLRQVKGGADASNSSKC